MSLGKSMYFMICLSKHGKHDHEYLRYLSGSCVSYYNILSQSVYGGLQCQRAYIDKRAHKYHGKTSLKHRHFHHGYYFRCHIILTVFTFCSLSITIFATKNCRCQVPLYYCCGGCLFLKPGSLSVLIFLKNFFIFQLINFTT